MKSLRFALPIALLLIIMNVPTLAAQGFAPERFEGLIDQRVRVRAPTFPAKLLKGKIVKVGVDTIVIRSLINRGRGNRWYENVGIPINATTSLEIRTRFKREWKKGMGYGFLAGAGMTGLLVASASPKDGTFFNGSERDLALVAGAVIIVPGTTLIGTLVGLCLKSESWEKVNLTSLRARIQPLHSGGLALSASFGF